MGHFPKPTATMVLPWCWNHYEPLSPLTTISSRWRQPSSGAPTLCPAAPSCASGTSPGESPIASGVGSSASPSSDWNNSSKLIVTTTCRSGFQPTSTEALGKENDVAAVDHG